MPALLGGLIAFVAVLFFGIQFVRGAATPLSCTVGANGVAVSVTARGTSARSVCDQLIAQTIAGYRLVYSANQESSNPTICSVSLNGNNITVHDSGTFKILGNAICAALNQGTTAASGFVQSPSAAAGLVQPAPSPVSPSVSQGPTAGSHCALGFQGHAVTVTADGPGATAWCSSVAAQEGRYYQLASVPAASIVCNVTRAGMQLVVRDTGLKTYGKQICQSL